MDMTAQQRIKRQILIDSGIEWVAGEDIDAVWEREAAEWALQDDIEEFRGSGVNTGLECEYSRYYESDAVGRKMDDGTWVGWTYWHGGGKHGAPEEIEWIGGAYLLAVTEEEKMVTVRTFGKA